jgi:hypothetical protein
VYGAGTSEGRCDGDVPSSVRRLPATDSLPALRRTTAQLHSMYLHRNIKSFEAFCVLLFRITDGKVKHE